MSANENASFQSRAVVLKVLDELKKYIQVQQKNSMSNSQAGHYLLALARMNAPETAKPLLHKEMPPGAPIGCDF